MPAFHYTAIDKTGQVARGVMDAASEAEVIAHLQRLGQVPMRAGPATRRAPVLDLLNRELGRKALSKGELTEVTRELAVMLAAGQDLDRALRFLCEIAPNGRVRGVLEQLRDRVRDGSALASAMQAQPGSFPRLYVGLVRAGEAGGTLAETLDRMATLLERQRSLAATVRSAMIYPSLLTVVALGSIALLLTTVLPQFVPLFEQNGVALPGPTRLLIGSGDAISNYGLYGLAALAALVLAARELLRRPGPRLLADRFVLRLPVLGALAREVEAARFSRTLGTLIVNGVPLIAALGVVREALGNRAAAAAVDEAALSAKGGAGLARPLAERGVFPLRTIYLLRLGEETAQLGPMALRAAEIHEEKTRIGVQRLISILVPAITIVMGAAVAFIVASLLLAMLSLNQLVT
ncbi:MAG: type II secretion system F family protein [Acetobacteraceae bacterium]|nr:type II secretion system F family protein [Acetobacteraceae bacterium]